MNMVAKISDNDPDETSEWVGALQAILENEGIERAHYIIEELIDYGRRSGINLPYKATTAYLNTISTNQEERSPGDYEMEYRISSIIRWNALAMVIRANRITTELGGHISSFASSAKLYDVGFNHFWHAPNENSGGDLLFVQGHSAPGIYARAFVEGRLSEEQLLSFRQEVDGNGLSSYPHPKLMPEFWQFPTVSMGLGPIMAIYQARFMKYLHNRGIVETEGRKVWAFLGDGEMDEPESLGAVSLAGRENLDNLVFVVNCNLQRLDGPVRGNGKIIQELEGVFRGAGWNVIKLVWGSRWDPLLQKDASGTLRKLMEETVDGVYQACKARGGRYTRETFFGKYQETLDMVANLSDADIEYLNRGGHDAHKIYAAYAAAVKHTGQPTVILAKTVKGFGMGEAGEGQNITHQQKKMGEESLKQFRDRFSIPISDDEIAKVPFYRPTEDSEEMKYLRSHREALGGYMPVRRTDDKPLTIPELKAFDAQLQGTGDREISTTMALVRIMNTLLKNKQISQHIVPIVPDESRTFGMEGMFRQIGIYAPKGQLYEPEDANQLMFYKEDKKGQVLQEGINEAGAFCSWIAAASSYSTHGVNMIPFYIYYSMFGFQRIGDLAWAAGDMQCRGFLIGGTAGRTTLAGEGLQHQDGHSLIQASMIPNCLAYDPTFAYEMAVIVQSGLKRMYEQQENVFYYITAMNENYVHPAMPDGVEEDIIKGLYLFRTDKTGDKKTPHVQLMGSGTILNEVIAAADLLKQDFNIASDIWSATSINELTREAQSVERWNTLHPDKKPKINHVEKCLKNHAGPMVVATDYMRSYASQLVPYVDRPFHILGTDGFGRSDTRAKLRHFFEVNRFYIAVTALKALADEGQIPTKTVLDAIKKYEIDAEKPYSLHA